MSGEHDKTPRTRGGRDDSSSTSARATTVTAGEQTARLHALVIGDTSVATYPLPESGELKIGRTPQCEIMIDDTSISRVHALLRIGPPLAVKDLGSANGTRVHNRKIEPQRFVEIHHGEAIQVGSATIIVQRRAAPIRPRRLWTHDYFEVRLEEECARAARRGTAFAVMRVSCAPSTKVTDVQQALTDLVRLSDVVGEYGPREFEILLVDTAEHEVEPAERRIVGELERHGIAVRVGTARYPSDGRNADELMANAEARARGPRRVESSEPGRPRGDIVAERTMQDLYSLAARIAHGTISVLILGETGVGKEVLAEKVHKLSPRASKPYVKLNCAALSETLLESELFGHEKGSFTGAIAAKQGLLQTAHGGSVFLDEVGELPLSTQVKLLRVIEERMVLRVGGLKPQALDVRFIAATNRDLEAEIERGTFRQDLYFRLNGATLVIPPLRERPNEIAGLARAFLATAARQINLPKPPELSTEVLDALLHYGWPGNIRELRNMMERAALLCGGGTIEVEHLPLQKMRVTFATAPSGAKPPQRSAPAPRPVVEKSEPVRNPLIRRSASLTPEEERERIEAALLACGGNQTRAAKLLGIGRRTLINRVKEFGLVRPRGGASDPQ